MQGFRKVDPDRWEFANEGFLGGQRHLLKTIKRRRHAPQSVRQEAMGGACLELGQFGLEGDIEILRRDRHVLMAEIVRLRQQQQQSMDQITAMEDRLLATEKKQQQMMTFLVKALQNPSFVHQFSQSRELKGLEIGKKRRLTTSSSLENLQQESISLSPIELESGQQDELTTVENEIEIFFSSALDNESSNNIKVDPIQEGGNMGSIENSCGGNDTIWEDIVAEEIAAGDGTVEELVGNPVNWDDGLKELVDQMGYLRSKP